MPVSSMIVPARMKNGIASSVSEDRPAYSTPEVGESARVPLW